MLTDTAGSLRSAPSLLSRTASLSAGPLFVALWLLGGCAQAPGSSELWNDGDSQTTDEDETPSSRSDASSESEGDEDEGDDERPTARRDAAPADPGRDAALPGIPPAAEAGAGDAAVPTERPPVPDAGSGNDEMADSGAPEEPPTKDAAAPPDTGTAAPSDAGAAPAACASTPSYLTPDACSQCICAKCASEVAVCYASPDRTKNQQCRQIRECAQANQCAGTECYCGDSSRCLTEPTGACVEVIQRVAGTDSTLQIMSASNDPASPVGRANTLSMCSQSSCAAECGF